MIEKGFKEGIQTFQEALKYDGLASTREDLAGVEETYWIAFNLLKDSPEKEHRLICAQCLEAVAHILDGEGRKSAADDLRLQAEKFRKKVLPNTPSIEKK